MSEEIKINPRLRNYFLIGFIINLAAFYPGFLSPDSIDQYNQALSGKYTDWHPPVMAFIWSLLNNLNKTSGLMLAMQLSWFWYACYVLAGSIDKPLWRILIIILSLAPFVHNFSGYIIKDSQMAFAWLLAFALMFRQVATNMKPGKGTAIAVALLLLYGSWVRPNALPGAIPLCAMFAFIYLKNRNFIKIATSTIAILIFIVGSQYLFNKSMHPEKTYPESKLFLHDIAGIYVKTGDNYFPSMLYANPDFDTLYIKKLYHPATFDNIWWNNDNKVILKDNNTETYNALKTAWKKAIVAHPGVYLKNRFEGLLYYLRLKERNADFMFRFRWMQPNTLGLTNEANNVSDLIFRYVEAGEHVFYMKPWFWIMLNILLFVFIPWVKGGLLKQGYIVLLLSSFLYFLPQVFIFQTDTDFRYFYWNCIACTVALFILIISRRKTVSN